MIATPQVFEKHIPILVTTELALDRLSLETALSKQRLKHAMQKGCVWLTRGQQTHMLRRASKPVQQGDVLHIYYDEQVLAQQPPQATLLVDEGAYSVWFKPYGMYSQGIKWGDHCTISRYAEQCLPKKHRKAPSFRAGRMSTTL